MTDERAGAVPEHPYGEAYFRHYHSAEGPVPYDRSQPQWLEFFGRMADRIATDIKPRRVLDVGCAVGFLVECLRDRGIEAFGVDISEYAIGQVRPDIRPYCRVGSAAEPLDGEYDLITCIEVLEHLPEASARRAIAHMAAAAPDVLFSSTPDAEDEPTHVNIHPRGWWIDRFAEVGLSLDPGCDGRFIAPHAMRFRRSQPATVAIDALLDHRYRLWDRLAEQEALATVMARRRDRLQSDLNGVRRGAEAMRREVFDLRGQVWMREVALMQLMAQVAALRQSAEEKDRLIAGLNYHLLAVQRTIGWKVLERGRRVRDLLLPADSRRRTLYWRVRRPVEVMLDEGPRGFFWKTRHKLRLKWKGQEFLVKAPPPEKPQEDGEARYQLWVQRQRLGAHDLVRLRAEAARLPYRPVISVVVPVYNTDEHWLRRCIESVREQVYPHWELCIANDASTAEHVRRVLDEYVAAEPRIWVKHLSRNQGIAGASNHAIELASGEFVALLDHDDELPPEALLEVARALNADADLDLIYTDEDKLDAEGRRVEPFFKPDWSPDLLLSMNYITHFAVFRRSLLNEIGGFRMGLDGSQDYDLLLRFTERTSRIAHIPRILYHWRKIPGSAAASPAAKPYAYEAARQAIEDAVRRRGREAQVDVYLPGLYTVRYAITDDPLVSIIIPTRDRWSLLQQCLRSIEEKTRYARYEIVVLDNDSVEPETRRGLDAVGRKWRVLHCPGEFNFSALNNMGAREAKGEYLLFLNNDTQVIEPGWLGAMLEHAQRAEVGAVGARLHYPDGRIQHAGLVLGIGGVADHAFRGLPGEAFSYFALGHVVRNVSSVTAACMMVPRRVFEELGGFDEDLRVALNDVDFCLRLRQKGYLVVYTPHALLYHHESGTRGRLHPPGDEERVWQTWGDVIRKGDPYYNPNLTLSRTDWTLADRP